MIRSRQTNAARIRRRLGDLYDDAGVDPGYVGTQASTDVADAGGFNGPGHPITSPTSPSTNWGAVATVFANDFTKIAGPIISTANRQAPYYITGSNGAQVLYDPNTGQVATAKTTATTDLAAGVKAVTAAIPSGYLIAGAAALLGLTFLSSRRK